MKDRQALLFYLGIVLLCAACFAVGISVGRATQTTPEVKSSPQSTVRNPQSAETPGR
ncbi:MAG TPA: hypothetical protein VFD58_00655 [Blastocatellia bacterium]|nr:hypothetical protein [Blastocatellia bacterium]